MTDFAAILDPIYLAQGVAVTVTPGATGVPVDMTAIDQTAGTVITEAKTLLQVIKPACSLRMSELSANNVAPADLKNGEVTLYPLTANAVTWRIENYAIKPSPSGPGEVQLILIKVP